MISIISNLEAAYLGFIYLATSFWDEKVNEAKSDETECSKENVRSPSNGFKACLV